MQRAHDRAKARSTLTTAAQAPSASPSVTESIAQLEQREFDHPEDPQVKAALARAYWCKGERGLAIEHWLWVVQFASESTEAVQAREVMQRVEHGRESDIAGLLHCGA